MNRTQSSNDHAETPDFLRGGGEMGALLRAHDWAATSVGPPEGWPQGLRTAIRLMLNTGHPVYIFWGPDCLCFYNDAYRPSLGPERHPHSLGRPAREVWGEIWHLIGRQLDQVMSGGGATWNENRLIPMTRNGRLEDVYWTYSYSPIDDETASSGIGGVLTLCTETTAQVELACRLAISEERLQLALSSGRGVGAWDWDVKRDTVVADERFARLYGVNPNRAKAGAPIEEFFAAIHLEDRPRIEARVAAVLRTGEVFSEEYRLVQDDGSAVWVFAEGRPVLDDNGEPTRFPGVSFDVTERKATEEALARSEERFRNLADNISQLAWTCDRLGDVDWYNKRWLDYTGLSFEEMRDWGWKQVQHPDHVDRVVASVTSSRESGEPWEDTFPLRGGDGRYRWFLSRAVPIHDQSGDIVRWFGTNTDITEQLEAEQQLKQLTQTLEIRIEQRTNELMQAEEALRQSQKMEAMGQLTGGVAHDFNNLLTPIVGSLDLLRRRDDNDARAQRLIDGAAESAERARVLVQRLLAFARRQPLKPVAVDVRSLLDGLRELLGSTLGPRINVVLDVPNELPNANGDAHQLEMALLNLSVNARDAMPNGGQLTVSARSQHVSSRHRTKLPPGDYLCLSVTDTGIGMDEDTRKRAIEPFFSTKGIGKGTGLGLSMVHGLAAQLGGTMTVSSGVGVGTNVELWLPVANQAFESIKAAHTQLDETIAEGTALLVDDDELARISTAEMLTDLGYSVVQAQSAEDALRLLDGGLNADLVVTDHLMPGKTGAELAREVIASRPNTPILIVSGYADVDGIAPDLQHLTKPFKQAELASAVAKLSSPNREHIST